MSDDSSPPTLSHVDREGRVQMVDVSGKPGDGARGSGPRFHPGRT